MVSNSLTGGSRESGLCAVTSDEEQGGTGSTGEVGAVPRGPGFPLDAGEGMKAARDADLRVLFLK